MSFTFNKETRRSLRERLRDGINLIPGASSVVQPPPNLLDTNNPAKKIGQTGQQKKSHSVDSTQLSDESIKMQQPPCSPSYLVAENTHHGLDGDSRSGSVSSCSSASSSPSKYRTYVVKNNDTVTSIAASFDCTPSELLRVNRLITARVLFPGQVLKIPNKKTPQQQPEAPVGPPPNDPATASMLETLTYAQRKFLKVKVRHVTDGNGVVCGTLLITPNASCSTRTSGGRKLSCLQGPGLLWGETKLTQLVEEDTKIEEEGEVKPDATPETENHDPETDDSKSRLEQVTEHPLSEAAHNNITTWYFCLTIGRPKHAISLQENKGRGRNPLCITYGQKNIVRPEFWFSVSKEQVPELYKYWMFWWPHLYGEVDSQVISDRGYEAIDWDNLDVLESGVSLSTGQTGEEEQSMAQELNELTKESWEMLKQPYAKLSSFITTRGSSIMKSSSHSSQSSVSELSHAPHVHPASSTSGLFNSHTFSITNPMNSFFFDSFSNISPNHSVFDDTDDDDDEFADSSFEQVVTNEELRNLLAMGGDEMMAIHLPELIGGKSEILEEDDIKNITRHLTARAEGYPWTLIFTSSRDGFSLNSLYRRNSLMQEESPVMLLIQDTNSRAFGALVSCSFHTSDSFYGTGQSFLFTLRPEFKLFKWTGENLFFVKGNHDGIWIGAGDGKFGLYVDGDLNCGRTEPCQTYGNGALTEPEDFIIRTLECWAFGNYVLSTEGTSEAVK
ncbi:Oxidation resistance protein 1 [Orchesella cincta]|uniref:Oxidation resistance protein 1 n=1 Tax=Orchesella cincta TaxID=48709 RepID=A0A1D2NHK7_ORCCI|nr:Oxidation resistance protein 1 [Orchesella cincta]